MRCLTGKPWTYYIRGDSDVVSPACSTYINKYIDKTGRRVLYLRDLQVRLDRISLQKTQPKGHHLRAGLILIGVF